MNKTDPSGTYKLSKDKCQELLMEIKSALDKAAYELAELVPESDAEGGHRHPRGVTRPAGHCEETLDALNSARNAWADFNRGDCWRFYRSKNNLASRLSKRTDALEANLEKKLIKTLWHLYHRWKSGKISTEEFSKVLRRLASKMGKKALRAVIKKVPGLSAIFFFVDWYQGGLRHALDEATWPLSEIWN